MVPFSATHICHMKLVMPEEPIYPILIHIISPCWLNHHCLLHLGCDDSKEHSRVSLRFSGWFHVVLKISAYLKTIGIAGFKGLVFQGHSGAFYWFKPHLQWENRGFPVKISLQPIHGWHMLKRLVSYQPKKSWYSHFTGTSHIIASNPLTLVVETWNTSFVDARWSLKLRLPWPSSLWMGNGKARGTHGTVEELDVIFGHHKANWAIKVLPCYSLDESC
jgi:hypothetical protein